MNTHYKNFDKNFLINFGSADNCFQKQTFLNNQPSQKQQYPIIQQVVRNKKALKRNNTSSLVPLGQPKTPAKSPALRFKMESVGRQPEDDDDLDMCPARVRPSWPSKIIPWWTASYPDEKPPYSYATLIAHAILSSKDGRLTLNDIYSWIADNYNSFSVGAGGWQNSIRHNLSLNKKWFYKIDRRPTQANPGKGCYWTLVAGAEQIFIDNLTQEGGHSRKHHDIGLTAELSISQRRGACYYRNAPIAIVPPGHTNKPLQGTSDIDSNNTNDLTTPPLTPIKVDLPKPLLSPLYTTFKMVNMAEKPQQQQQSENVELLDDSDNDSGIDVSIKFVDTKHLRKRRRTTSNKNCSVSASKPSMQSTKHVDTSMIYDTPTSTSVASFDLASTSSPEINSWTKCPSLCSENLLFDDNIQHDQCQWSTTYVTPNLADDDSWCESTVAPPTSAFVNNATFINDSSGKGQPIVTINLDNEEITHKYLHLEEDEDDLPFFDEQLTSSFNNNISSSMPISNNTYINANNNNKTYYTVYPHSPPFSPTEKLANTTSSMNIIIPPPPPFTSTFSLYNYQLQQFVTMQDILYS